jgi:hypothetical protein
MTREGHTAPSRVSRRGFATVAVAALAAAAILGTAWPSPTFRPRFDRNGIVADETSERLGGAGHTPRSSDWIVTSGALYGSGGLGWSGSPDGSPPAPGSPSGTDSSVLRLISRRNDFGDVHIHFSLRVVRLSDTTRTPPRPHDGVHLFARYKSAQELYVITVQRRDGRVMIKRKNPGGPSNGGRYTELVSAQYPLTDSWQRIDARITDVERAVLLEVAIGGTVVMRTLDQSSDRIIHPGAVGLRGDNAEFYFGDFVADPL